MAFIEGTVGTDVLRGTDGDDVIRGLAGDDRLDSFAGDDLVAGGDGDDIIATWDGNNVVYGGPGDDRLYSNGFAGEPGRTIPNDDVFTGGPGADVFVIYWLIDAPADVIEKHRQPDGRVIYGPAGVAGENNYYHNHWVTSIGDDVITDFDPSQGDSFKIEGHSVVVDRYEYGDFNSDGAQDTKVYFRSSDPRNLTHDGDAVGTLTLLGYVTSDLPVSSDFKYGVEAPLTSYFYGTDAPETYNGFAGDDRIYGGGGADTLYGSFDDDLIYGGDGDDRIFGQYGDDIVSGYPGDDYVDGGPGNDAVRGKIGNDELYGRAGDDVLYGQEGDDVGYGGIGNDRLVGAVGADRLKGEAGDDAVFGSEGDDVLLGGPGNDTLNGGTGNDRLISVGWGGNPFAAGSGGDDDQLIDVAGGDSFEFRWVFDGTPAALAALAAATDLSAALATQRVGQDLWIADMGDDVVRGFTPGEDSLVFAGYGLQVVDVVTTRDVVGSGALDTILTFGIDPAVDTDLAAATVGTVTVRDAQLSPGDWTVSNEAYVGHDAADTFTTTPIVTATSSPLPTLQPGRTALILGSEADDRIGGTDGNDQIYGRGGNDTIFALEGADLVYGGADDDKIVGSRGGDRLYGQAGNDEIYGSEGNDVLAGGPGADLVRGDTGNDRLISVGWGGNPFAAGSGGDDDQLIDVAGGDSFEFRWVFDGTPAALAALAAATDLSAALATQRVGQDLWIADMGDDVVRGFTPGEDSLVFAGYGLQVVDVVTTRDVVGSGALDTILTFGIDPAVDTDLAAATVGTVTVRDAQLSPGDWTVSNEAYVGHDAAYTDSDVVEDAGTAPAPRTTPIRIEAEAFTQLADGGTAFFPEDAAAASGGEVVRLPFEAASASLSTALDVFGVTAGTYEVTVGYVDEFDGTPRASLSLDDVQIAGWSYAEGSFVAPDGARGNITEPGNFKTLTFAEPVSVDDGAELTFESAVARGAPARFDYVEFTPLLGV